MEAVNTATRRERKKERAGVESVCELSSSDPLPVLQRIRVSGKLFEQAGRRIRVQGVTYGPFAHGEFGDSFPVLHRLRHDFQMMRSAGINAVRTYHAPPARLLETAEEQQIQVFVDIPWSKHLCFLDSRRSQVEARQAVEQGIKQCRDYRSLFAYSIANEIPANIVRWHGARRIERFLAELADVARQADPETLVTYANYPSTEYLDLSFLDFVTFNVYLHDRAVFRRYLHRLQNIVGDQPLLLGELGMDTLRHGEQEQAEFLAGHLREAALLGLAGAFVFSWTDDWHTGGHQIEDWAFGLTDRQRQPKAAFHAVREVFEDRPLTLLPVTPRVSVVVCTYNGGGTLAQCLESLELLDYPDYEIIVVDDGSTDHTADILERFPSVRSIRQQNHGLSVARNVGLQAASGSIVAYTDSDCFVDPDWLTLLVAQLQESGAHAVGGPNLTPDDGWLAACVAACPGQPTHVLESDQVAEHIPGCNMAFRREALEAIQGFDYQYRTAGDDVDLCWRLQHAGYWITFAPSAFVWHHRRQTPRAYLRQQAGYGAAEAMVRFNHPDRFNGRGDGKWNGVLYGASLQGLCLTKPIIYRGTFGTGLFQTLYQPRPAHWAMLPATIEWHAVIALWCLMIPLWGQAASVALAMWGLSLGVALLQAAQARVPALYDGLRSRAVIMLLCYAQPLVRGWHRQRTRLFKYRTPSAEMPPCVSWRRKWPRQAARTASYWSELGLERTDLLRRIIARLGEQGWSATIDTGWKNWDVEIFCHPWTVVRIATAQEEHGGNRRLIRLRYLVRPSGYTKTLWTLGAVIGGIALLFQSWPYATVAAGLALCGWLAYWRGSARCAAAGALTDAAALSLDMIRCDVADAAATEPVTVPATAIEPCG